MDCEYHHYGAPCRFVNIVNVLYEDCEFCNNLCTHKDCEYFRPHNVLPTKTASVDNDTSNFIYMV